MVRSIIAVIAGLIVMIAIVALCTLIAVPLLVPGDTMTGEVEPGSTWLVVNLAYSLVAAVAGGWLTATVAMDRRMLHAAILAFVVFLLAIPGIIAGGAATGQPGWYPVVVAAVGILGVLAGGRLARRKV